MAHPLEKRISERLDVLRQLEAEMDTIRLRKANLEAEISAYRDALQYVLPRPERARRSTTSSDKRSGVGDTWKDVISAVSGRYERSFTTDNIMEHSTKFDLDMKRATVRAQCANFVKSGYLVRISDGVFAVTDAGRNAFNIIAHQTETAGGSLGTPTPAAS